MRKINLCILGCGSVAKLHSRVARTMKSQVNLLYASRDLAKAQEYNRKFKGIGAFGNYEKACVSPDVQAVFICTPHAYHVEHATLAAKYKKPMLIEKPITRTLDELSEIEKAVTAAGAPCMVAENYYFKPLVAKLRHHLDSNTIGTPLFIELNRSKRSKISGWRADAEMMGGGALLEGGVHWVNMICRLGGAVEEVLAVRPAKAYKMVAPFEDSLEILLKFADGTVGKMLHSWNLSNRIGGLCWSKICGTEGNIQFESNGVLALILGNRTRLSFPGFLDIMGYRAMLAHFLECVRENKPPEMSLEVARRDMAIVKAAYRSLKTSKFERV
ncbi:MAG: Gfo/Idh/MocA family protein [bacterium]